jgi:glycosyltransferase involved in cell wall biosynthesis
MSPRAVPRVSVVIPTFNRARDLTRCLDSLLNQSFADFEVLVCDDGSTDDTARMVSRYTERLRLTYHWAENFGGPARPRNAGLRLASAPYVALLDSDDWWHPQKLARSVARLDAGADVIYHDLYLATSFPPGAPWRRQRTQALKPPCFPDLLRRGNVIANSSVVIRTEILRRIGGFSEDPTLIAWEDYDAWLRIARVTERFERLRQPLGYYWAGGGNISSPRRTLRILERLEELYLRPGSDTDLARKPGWYHYMLALAYYQLGIYDRARENLRAALRGGLPAARYAKALMTLSACRGHMLLGSRPASGP